MPNYRALRDPDGLAEERRIMYVAMTRAKDNLYITDSGGYNTITNDLKSPSRFISESLIYEMDKESIPVELGNKNRDYNQQSVKDVTKYQVGDIVRHPVFKGSSDKCVVRNIN